MKKNNNNDEKIHRRTYRYPPSKTSPSIQSINVDPTKTVGTYVKPGKDWDALVKDPNVWVIDTRNNYEIEVGTFQNAINPNTECFQEFPSWLRNAAKICNYDNDDDDVKKMGENNDKNESSIDKDNEDGHEKQKQPNITPNPKAIAMFCTGGIRCEKATSYVLSAKLFPENVPIYHLEGGILAYLDNIKDDDDEKTKEEEENTCTFNGECYVFDHRVAVGKGCKETKNYKMCFGCRKPLSLEEIKQHYDDNGGGGGGEEKKSGDGGGNATATTSSDYIPGVCCPRCRKNATDKQRFMERQKQIEIAKKRGVEHMHDPKELGGGDNGSAAATADDDEVAA